METQFQTSKQSVFPLGKKRDFLQQKKYFCIRNIFLDGCNCPVYISQCSRPALLYRCDGKLCLLSLDLERWSPSEVRKKKSQVSKLRNLKRILLSKHMEKSFFSFCSNKLELKCSSIFFPYQSMTFRQQRPKAWSADWIQAAWKYLWIQRKSF